MRKVQKSIVWAILVSETSHVFCCVLPTLFSVLSFLSSFGVVVSMPGWLSGLHEIMHRFEGPMIGFSALVMALGWALYAESRRMDCHDTGCHHGACAPRKNTSYRILVVATALMVFNLFVYFVFHRG